ncbi:hypothetical protein [Acetobacter oeni]|uniref:hypothetical protein n=1 Tax=Acetobacter oeni TaxID=304077 RepID=UPI0011BDEAF9|nr:hypothetical protein [Acetobacter oeni]MBB3882241.1 cellobiose-specific phosphotransferase system component IIB [Acetobacter oeni]NHO17997.1 hypothetical protein [Acetobacter oeni]
MKTGICLNCRAGMSCLHMVNPLQVSASGVFIGASNRILISRERKFAAREHDDEINNGVIPLF